MQGFNVIDLKKLFENAFGWRHKPANIFGLNYIFDKNSDYPLGILIKGNLYPVILSDGTCIDPLYEDTRYFKNHDWRKITADEIYIYSDVITGTNPEAFCYFLPGILYAVYRENRIDCNAIDSLICGLEDSRAERNSESFCYERWSLLTTAELSAVKEWLNRYYEINGIGLDDYKMAIETLDWLAANKLTENK
jgi:hypothetical protein